MIHPSLQHVNHQLQRFPGKHHHVPLPISRSGLYLPRIRSIGRRHSQRNISSAFVSLIRHIICTDKERKKKKKRNIRSPVPGAPPSRSCSSTLTDSIRRPQCSSDVIGQSRYNLGCRPGIALDIGRGPAGKSNSGF